MAARSFLQEPGSNFKLRVLFMSLIFSASALLFIALVLFLLYLYFSALNRSRTIPFDSPFPSRLTKFSYRELRSATNSFDPANSIGKGGCGAVFRGILCNGKSVAIKELASSSPVPDREFQNEIQILGALRSPFIVSLLGYCTHKNKRLLVYEYMPHRSLQQVLFGHGSTKPKLGWAERFEIVRDVARGLHFLHRECDPPVIHGDIKPSNVLLSLDYRAKISDFGLSRVKMEADVRVDLCSQELSPSQELCRSQELSANSAPALVNNEVDSVLPPLAPSCKHIRLDSSRRTSKSCCLMCSESDYHCHHSKGKDVVSDCGREDLIIPDEEFCHSTELALHPSSPSLDDVSTNSKQWGQDWWWRQDGSEELCSKDYVMEWIGSQICPSNNLQWDKDFKLDHSRHPALDDLDPIYKYEAPPGTPLRDTVNSPVKETVIKRCSGHRCGKDKKKIREWWKEEPSRKICKTSNKIKKFKGKWKEGFMTMHFGLGRRFMLRKNGCSKEEMTSETDINSDFSFRKGWSRKRSFSVNSDMWSGDFFSRDLSSTTSMRGTICYVAPECGGCGSLLEKADIYSFGVLILVIISGRRPLHILSSPMKLEKASLVSWCRLLARRGKVLELVDEKLKDEFNKDQANLCINLALMCLQRMPELRPDIGDIVKILKGDMDLPSLALDCFTSPPSKLFSRSRRRSPTKTE